MSSAGRGIRMNLFNLGLTHLWSEYMMMIQIIDITNAAMFVFAIFVKNTMYVYK